VTALSAFSGVVAKPSVSISIFDRDGYRIDSSHASAPEDPGRSVFAELAGHPALLDVARGLAGEQVHSETRLESATEHRDYLPRFDAGGEVSELVCVRTVVPRAAIPASPGAATPDLRALQDLAGGLAHHLNGSLTAILSYSEFLDISPNLSDHQRSQVAAIQEAGARLRQLSESLHAFSGHSVQRTRWADLRAIVSRSVDEQAFAERPGVTVELPPEPILISADEAQLQQALASLIGGGPAAVTIVLEAAGAFATLDIHTTAFDSADGAAQSLFEPRFRVEPRPGLALDLPAAYGIIAGHGGSVSAIPAANRGVRFVVVLPLDRAPGVLGA
jgi:signal transduction histidine kinase